MRLLVAAKCSPTQKAANGYTAMHIAAEVREQILDWMNGWVVDCVDFHFGLPTCLLPSSRPSMHAPAPEAGREHTAANALIDDSLGNPNYFFFVQVGNSGVARALIRCAPDCVNLQVHFHSVTSVAHCC